MILFNRLLKISFILGFLFLSMNATGATERRDSEFINDSIKDSVEQNVFYVERWVKDWFDRVDKNQDDQISKSEFLESMEPFKTDNIYNSLFTSEKNPDGKMNLAEFNSFIDTSGVIKNKGNVEMANVSTGSSNQESMDVIKLLAGVLGISFLMAAFRLL